MIGKSKRSGGDIAAALSHVQALMKRVGNAWLQEERVVVVVSASRKLEEDHKLL